MKWQFGVFPISLCMCINWSLSWTFCTVPQQRIITPALHSPIVAFGFYLGSITSPKSDSVTSSTYLITDLDTMLTEDVSKSRSSVNTSSDTAHSFRDPPKVQRITEFPQSMPPDTSPQTSTSPNYTSTLTWDRKPNNRKYDVNQNTLNSGSAEYSGEIASHQSISHHKPTLYNGESHQKPTHQHGPSFDKQQYSPMDFSQADDNTKRFFGKLFNI